MKKSFVLFTLSLIPWIGLSQYTIKEINAIANNSSESQLVVEASRILQEDYYYFSEIIVDKLLTIKPESSNYNYRKGFIVLNSRNDFQTALKHLEIGAKSVSKNFDMYSSKETSAPVDVYYHLGRCYHLDEQFDKAIEHYNLFIQNSRKKSELIDKANLGITQCGVAKQMLATPKSATVKNLDIPINTNNPEYSPVISLDGKSLYFTSRRPWEDSITEIYRDPQFFQYPEDIYVSILSDTNEWKAPSRLDFCDPKINEATIALNIDEKRVYAYQDITGGGDIYLSDFRKNQFQLLEPFDVKNVNTQYWETHCTFTPDGNDIYFVSNRPGGYGGRDIYRITKIGDSWSEPQNLGPEINTKYDEESPFIAIDNKTMYFASNGPNSIGGFDIFVTVRNEDNTWSAPINLGYPINSTGDDLFYTTTVDGLRGYLSSFRKGGKGEKDIYEIENDYLGIKNIIVLKGNIHTPPNVELPADAHVILKCPDCRGIKETKLSLRQRDGAFLTSLEQCRDYEIIFMRDNVDTIYSEVFKTSCKKEYAEIYKEASITKYSLAGLVVNKATKEPIKNVKVEILDAKTLSVLEVHKTDEEGKFASHLLDEKKYKDSINYLINTSASGHLLSSQDFKMRLGKEGDIQKTIEMDKMAIGLDIGKIVAVNPIYFDLGKWDIRPDAQVELDKIVKVLNENPSIVIELGSHTDCRGTKAANLKLSDKRAKSSAEYIKKRIDNPARIYGKGYGESKLLNDCKCEGNVKSDCPEEKHQENRRTEFKIVKNLQ